MKDKLGGGAVYFLGRKNNQVQMCMHINFIQYSENC